MSLHEMKTLNVAADALIEELRARTQLEPRPVACAATAHLRVGMRELLVSRLPPGGRPVVILAGEEGFFETGRDLQGGLCRRLQSRRRPLRCSCR